MSSIGHTRIYTSLTDVTLERRPDIAEAERKMQQQNALIGVAVAAFYQPSISRRLRAIPERLPLCPSQI